MRKVIINVTQRDIDKGIPKNPCACPIHRAVSRRFRGQEICVEVNVILVGATIVQTPLEAFSFMGRFDRSGGIVVKPFKFAIEVPDDL
jgi:hypothetical protein